MSLNYLILFIMLLIAFLIDAKSKIIPNWLTISGIIIGLLYNLYITGILGLISAIIGILVGLIIFLLLYALKAVGAGDVKLFAAIGALTNLYFLMFCIAYSIIFAGIIGLTIIIYKRRVLNYSFPFMYAVLPGAIATYYNLYLL